VGNFITTVRSEGRVKEIRHGAAILATGADEYKPTEYFYGKDDRVLTQLELEEQITKGEKRVINSRSLVMIQCVGCRQEDRNYCARICCSQAIKNALKLKEINPKMDIYILFRDMRTYGFTEDYYREAADKDVTFIRWEPDDKPQVESATEEGKPVLRINVPDPILGQRLVLDADLLVLSAAVVPSMGSQEIARLFKAPLNPDGFFQEAHVKLRPVDFAAEGVFLCGTAHYPKHISETISQAYGAAGRAVTLLSQDTVTASGSVCEVKEHDCVSCGACITACTYGAIEFRETPEGKKARVNAILCKGDGLCNAKCPTKAIRLKHYTDEEIFCQIDAAAPPLAEDEAGEGILK
jgi:heterodisulfide reductase subunit A